MAARIALDLGALSTRLPGIKARYLIQTSFVRMLLCPYSYHSFIVMLIKRTPPPTKHSCLSLLACNIYILILSVSFNGAQTDTQLVPHHTPPSTLFVSLFSNCYSVPTVYCFLIRLSPCPHCLSNFTVFCFLFELPPLLSREHVTCAVGLAAKHARRRNFLLHL